MTCEVCGAQPSGLEFIVPDNAWDALSPHGDARGRLCLECADRLAYEAGLRDVQIEIMFIGKALRADNPKVANALTPAMYRASAAKRAK